MSEVSTNRWKKKFEQIRTQYSNSVNCDLALLILKFAIEFDIKDMSRLASALNVGKGEVTDWINLKSFPDAYYFRKLREANVLTEARSAELERKYLEDRMKVGRRLNAAERQRLAEVGGINLTSKLTPPPKRPPFAYEPSDGIREIQKECEYHLLRLLSETIQSNQTVKLIAQYSQILTICRRD